MTEQKTEMQRPLIGQKIQDFEFDIFHNEEIKKVKISDYAGKWVILFFYPADFTFVCPTELEDLAHKYEEIKGTNAEVISFSTDTAFTHKAWHDNSEAIKKVQYPMGSDATGKISKNLGIYIEDEGVTLRSSFIIDPEGIIKACEIHDNSIGRDADELFRKLQAAQYTHKHGDQVCPAKWKPGEKTLKPGIDLVGKI